MRRMKMFVWLSLMACVWGSADAALVHRYDFLNDPNDQIGNADLTLVGFGTRVINGALDLPGSGTRTHHATALGPALTEIAGTINGSDTITMEAWFNLGTTANWRKLMMVGDDTGAGSGFHYMDMTPRRGRDGYGVSCSIDDGVDEAYSTVGEGHELIPGIDYYMVTIWNETDDTLTVAYAPAGDPSNLVVSIAGMGGKDLANVTIDQFYLGSAVGFSDEDLHGRVKEFRIYNNALSIGTIMGDVAAGPDTASVVLVSPEAGAVDVLIDDDLAWNAPAFTSLPLINYDVYLGIDADAVADATRTSAEFLTTVDAATESYDPGTLAKDTRYFWRIDQIVDDGSSEPNAVKGAVWSFETEKAKPVITNPADTYAKITENGSFSLDITSVSTVNSVVWYKVNDSSDIELSPGTKYIITFDDTAAALTITDVQDDDAGDYYCVVTNAAGPTTSASALLSIARRVAWYEFETVLTEEDPNVPDSSGFGNTGTASGVAAQTTGIIGNALEFDGTSWIDVPRSIQDDFTIAFWMKTTQTTTGDRWYKGAGLVSGEMPGTVNDFGVALHTPSNPVAAVRNYGNELVALTSVNDDAWHYVVMTREKATGVFKLYLDGADQGSSSDTTASLTVPDRLTIAAHPGGSNPFVGTLDDVSFYNFVMTHQEIIDHYFGITGKGVCLGAVTYDLNDDCRVNLIDFALLAGSWLECNLSPQIVCGQ